MSITTCIYSEFYGDESDGPIIFRCEINGLISLLLCTSWCSIQHTSKEQNVLNKCTKQSICSSTNWMLESSMEITAVI